MKYCPVLATLGYVLCPAKSNVLLIHRNKRADDIHFGKYNGLGGKLNRDEDVVTGMRREIKEESNIEALDLVLRGTISWPGFGKNGEDWFGFVFRIDQWSGTPNMDSSEGTLEWVPLERLNTINLRESDRHWLSMIFDNSTQTFHAHAPFDQGQLTSWSCVRL